MNLDDALRETGCAVSTQGVCITSVEWLGDGNRLLMTRRGVCIIQCVLGPLAELALEERYTDTDWIPARVRFEPIVDSF